MACRRRDFLILSNNSFTDLLLWLFSWLQFWPSSQSSRIFNLLLVFDEALSSGDRGRRGSPAVSFPLSSPPIFLISKSAQEETSLSRGVLPTTSEICFTILPNLLRSGFASAPLETCKHRNSWTTRPLPLHAHQMNQLWLSLELSKNSWWMKALGSSVHALPPVKPQPPHAKTLVWLEVNSLGLGPRHRQQSIGPINFSLKTNSRNCGPTREALLPKSRTIIKAHLPIAVPNRLKANHKKSGSIPNAYPLEHRCVYFHQRSSLIFLIVQHTVWDGRRLQPCRVATSYVLFVLIGLFEDLCLSKNFGNTQSQIRFNPSRTFSEWYRQLSNWSTKASPEESTHRISLTAGLYLGPLLESFPVRVSRMHGNSFFWMEISFIENFYRSCSSNFLPSVFSLMLCSYGSIERRLSSYLEITSMNWLCEYPVQILFQNSSINTSDENLLFLSFRLMPVRLKYMESSTTSQCHSIRTIHHLSNLIANVVATHLELASDLMLLCSCLQVLLVMMSKYLSSLSLVFYAITFGVSSLVLGKTLLCKLFLRLT